MAIVEKGGAHLHPANPGNFRFTPGRQLTDPRYGNLLGIDIEETPSRLAVLMTVASSPTGEERNMLAKARRLPSQKQKELHEWLDAALLATRNEQFLLAVSSISDEAFQRLWDNPIDAEYDEEV